MYFIRVFEFLRQNMLAFVARKRMLDETTISKAGLESQRNGRKSDTIGLGLENIIRT